MRYVFASSQGRVLDVWRPVLAEGGLSDLRAGYGPETATGCDAVVLAAPLVHDRYGGKPNSAQAQILENDRGDGLPSLIVAMPAVVFSGKVITPDEDPGIAPNPVLQDLVLKCLEAVDEFRMRNPAQEIDVLEFSIDGMMIPGSMHESAARAVLAAIRIFENAG